MKPVTGEPASTLQGAGKARGRAVAPSRLVETTWNYVFLVEGCGWGEAKDPHILDDSRRDSASLYSETASADASQAERQRPSLSPHGQKKPCPTPGAVVLYVEVR